MFTPPTFKQGPPDVLQPPAGEISIEAPPAIPGEPHMSLSSLFVPAGFTVAGLGVMAAVGTSGNMMLSMLISLPMILGSVVAAVISYRSQKNAHKLNVEQRE
ncbi:MAG: hypothetical protein Q7O66_01005, partial [Dehalococcoidia bacterium]|nr:hypothetical protein [Dehalococcoidia bacterium]